MERIMDFKLWSIVAIRQWNIFEGICLYIVACHLPRGSKLRWCEDMGGKLPSVRESRVD